MCGRFALFIDLTTLIEAFGLDPSASQLDLPFRYNIAPSQQILGICQNAEGYRHPRWFRWELIPHWAKDMAIGSLMSATNPSTKNQYG